MPNSSLSLGLGRSLESDAKPAFFTPDASYWGVKSLQGRPTMYEVMKVRRSTDNAVRTFTEGEINDGTMLSWVTASSSTADGYVRQLYDQSGRGNDFVQDDLSIQPKIVSNGVIHTDTEGKIAIDGKGAKMDLAEPSTNFFSSDGSWSLFLVTDFPDYSSASQSNVGILNFQTKTNGGANSVRKPTLAVNKSFNQLAVAQPTQTVGSNSTGNIYLQTYPGEQLFSNFGDPSLSTNNNEGFLDACSRGETGHATTDLATSVNTETDANKHEVILFQPNETGVSTSLTALIYSPTYLFSKKEQIERALVNLFDITFV